MAEGLGQESAMHRLVIACIMLALMAQGACAVGQTASNAQEKILENIPSYSQGSTHWCAWVSAQMVLNYYGYTVSPQEVAVKTFELAGQTWGGTDKNGLPPQYYKFYKGAIRSLSNNNIVVEEINVQDKKEVLNKIFEAIDRGYPIILLSGGPWLYDATDFPDSSWIEPSTESSWPSGNHASVIVGYSLKEEMNNFFSTGPLTFLTNLLDYPPVIKMNDPATAAGGVGSYWVSYDKFFEKTIGYPSVARLLIVRPSSEADAGSSPDGNPPILHAFRVAPLSLTSGESFEIAYTVSDDGGSGLKQVELWRKDETSDWQQVKINTLAGENGPVSGSFMDSPLAPGKYWYGVHVVDNAGNWNDEKNSNTNGQPSSFEPVEVEVKNPQEVTLTLYVHEGSVNGPMLSGAEVTGQDAAGSKFSQMTDANGFVVITGSPGSWQFTVTKPGYAANSWSQEITVTCTKHAFLLAEEPTTEGVASGSLICTLTGHSDKVTSVAFSPDGQTLASGSDDHTLKLWDVASRTEAATLAGHSNWVNCVAFSPDGRTLVSGSNDYTVKLWDVASRTEVATLPDHSSIAESVAFSPDGRTLAAGY
ncbi:WD domain, G-beta repeat [uncultured archaeon]|nr:WD domain, G-beta repeat [uncultured archaeon]